VFLIWWPAHVDGEGLAHLVLRGLLWTLAFEVLLLAFAPLERLITRAIKARLAGRRELVRARIDATPPRARAGGAVALACVGVAAPLLLLSDAGAPPKPARAATPKPKVIKQVIVKRPIVKREVVVRPEVVNAAPAPAPSAAPKTRTVVKRVVVERVRRVPVKTTPAPAAAEPKPATTTPVAPPAAAPAEQPAPAKP
jgi:hypothetical protein